jgi:hypothetical protein
MKDEARPFREQASRLAYQWRHGSECSQEALTQVFEQAIADAVEATRRGIVLRTDSPTRVELLAAPTDEEIAAGMSELAERRKWQFTSSQQVSEWSWQRSFSGLSNLTAEGGGEQMSESPGMELLKRDYAMHLMRAKFGGKIPAYVTPQECLELMNELAELQTKRAECLEKLYLDFAAVTVNPPLLVVKPWKLYACCCLPWGWARTHMLGKTAGLGKMSELVKMPTL